MEGSRLLDVLIPGFCTRPSPSHSIPDTHHDTEDLEFLAHGLTWKFTFTVDIGLFWLPSIWISPIYMHNVLWFWREMNRLIPSLLFWGLKHGRMTQRDGPPPPNAGKTSLSQTSALRTWDATWVDSSGKGPLRLAGDTLPWPHTFLEIPLETPFILLAFQSVVGTHSGFALFCSTVPMQGLGCPLTSPVSALTQQPLLESSKHWGARVYLSSLGQYQGDCKPSWQPAEGALLPTDASEVSGHWFDFPETTRKSELAHREFPTLSSGPESACG